MLDFPRFLVVVTALSCTGKSFGTVATRQESGRGRPGWRCVKLLAESGGGGAPIDGVKLLGVDRDQNAEVTVVLGLTTRPLATERVVGVEMDGALAQRNLTSELNPTDLYFRLRTQSPEGVATFLTAGPEQRVRFRLPVSRGEHSPVYTLSFDAGMEGGLQRWRLYRLDLRDPSRVRLRYVRTYTYVEGRAIDHEVPAPPFARQSRPVREREAATSVAPAWVEKLRAHRTYYQLENLEPLQHHFAVAYDEGGGTRVFSVATDSLEALDRLDDAALHRVPIYQTVRGRKVPEFLEAYEGKLLRRLRRLVPRGENARVAYLGRYRRFGLQEFVPDRIDRERVIGQFVHHRFRLTESGRVEIDRYANFSVRSGYGIVFDAHRAPKKPLFVNFALEGDRQGSLVLADFDKPESPWKSTVDAIRAAIAKTIASADGDLGEDVLDTLAARFGDAPIPSDLDQNVAFTVSIYARVPEGAPYAQAHERATVVAPLNELVGVAEVVRRHSLATLDLDVEFSIRFADRRLEAKVVRRSTQEALGTGSFHLQLDPVYGNGRQAVAFGQVELAQEPNAPSWIPFPGDERYRSYDLAGDYVRATYRNGPYGRTDTSEPEFPEDVPLTAEDGTVDLTPVAPPSSGTETAVPSRRWWQWRWSDLRFWQRRG